MGTGIPLPMALLMLAFAIPVLLGAYKQLYSSESSVVKVSLSLVIILGIGWVILWTIVLLSSLT